MIRALLLSVFLAGCAGDQAVTHPVTPGVCHVEVTFGSYAMGVDRDLKTRIHAVIAADYLKTFIAGIKKIFGGELRSYHRLMFRAREEAMVRMMEEARSLGYDAVCNVRIDSADIGGSNKGKPRAAMCAVLVSGTAYRRIGG